jgi:hypothetical protein
VGYARPGARPSARYLIRQARYSGRVPECGGAQEESTPNDRTEPAGRARIWVYGCSTFRSTARMNR